jgi:hypothetical protein
MAYVIKQNENSRNWLHAITRLSKTDNIMESMDKGIEMDCRKSLEKCFNPHFLKRSPRLPYT